MHAGNIDNKELVVGTTLFVPVFAKGALFEVGDGHAGQGNGDVDMTALETLMTGNFKFMSTKISICCGRAVKLLRATSAWVSMKI
jgi:acetamidase/formamidase